MLTQEVTRKIVGIEAAVRNYQMHGKSLFLTSSFQTQSLPLLHLVARIDKSIPVVFINTGYLFPETLEFRDEIVAELGLDLIELRPHTSKSEQRDEEGRLLFVSDPDRCCELNKIAPMDAVTRQFDLWISGVRADQSTARGQLRREQAGPNGTLRFHPMLDWTARDIRTYSRHYRLPEHPLEARGVFSVGCIPCTATRAALQGDSREGRWFGRVKSECGLHTDLAQAPTTQQ